MESIKCEAFLIAAETGSLTAAGEYLGYTQPGITRMIRSLEEEMGFPLFVRTKKGVTPTENGKAMISVFREIVRAHKNAAELGSEIRGMLSGVLTIGSYYSVSAMWMPEILKRYQQQFPAIRIRLREGNNREMAEWLTERSVDCCFAARPAPGTVCDWIPIREDELLAWLPAGHPMAQRKAFPLTELAKEPFIAIMPDRDTDLDRLLQEENITPDRRFSTADAYTAFRMVEAGLGISFNNRLISSHWSGGVVTIPFDPPRCITLGLAVPVLAEASPAARAFIRCVQEVMRQDQAQQMLP